MAKKTKSIKFVDIKKKLVRDQSSKSVLKAANFCFGYFDDREATSSRAGFSDEL